MTGVIVTPVVLVAVMMAIQVALTFHARNLTATAAESAARAVQAETGTTADAITAAARWLDDGGLITSHHVTVAVVDEVVTVTVTAEVASLVPFWDPTVAATVTGPTETFRPATP